MGTNENTVNTAEVYQPPVYEPTVNEVIPPEAGSTEENMQYTMNSGRILKKEIIDKLGRTVKEGYDNDLQSLDDMHKMWDEALKLAMQVLSKKDFPFEKSSNVVYPIITEAAINFNAMMYPNVMSDGNICKCKVVGDDSGQPMLMQDPRTGMVVPQLDPQTGQPIMQQAGIKAKLASSVSQAINYQLNEQMDSWEEEMDKMLIMLPIMGCLFKKVYYDECEAKVESDLILPHYFVVNFATKSLKSAPRMTQVCRMYDYEIKEKIAMGLFYANDYRPGEAQFPDGVASQQSTSTPYDDAMKPHMVLEQHLRYDLDGDGYAEPLIVTYHYDSNKVMRIEENYDIDAPTTLMRDGKIIYAKAKQYFVKFGFIPNPKGGFYDIGFGQLLLGLNTGINAIINQCIDAGTLSVAGGGFIGRGVRMKAGTLRFKPAEWKIIETTGASLRDAIYPIPYNEPSPVLFQLLGLLIASAEKIGSMRDVLAGEAVANQTATTTLALIEQGVKALKAISKRVFRGVKAELKLIFDLNAKYYPEQNQFGIKKELFNYQLVNIIPNMDVENLTNSLKLSRAQIFADMRAQGNQCIDEYESTKRIAESIQVEDVDKVVKPVEPTSQEIALQQSLAQNEQMTLQRDLMKQQNAQADLALKAEKLNAEIPKINADAVQSIALATKAFRDAGEPYTVEEIKRVGS